MLAGSVAAEVPTRTLGNVDRLVRPLRHTHGQANISQTGSLLLTQRWSQKHIQNVLHRPQ